MSSVSTIKMTSRQFLELGEDPVGIRLELVNGEVAVSPSPIPDHARAIARLTYLLVGHVIRHDLGEIFPDVDTLFGEFDVRRPDLMYFRKDRLHFVGEKAMEGPPDLCIEVLSPSSRVIDRKDKFKQYEKAKVAFYWIVDPKAKTIEGYKLTRGKYRLVGSGKQNEVVNLQPFSTLDIPLADLWKTR